MRMIGGVVGDPSRDNLTARKRVRGMRSGLATLGLLLFALPVSSPPAHAFDGMSLAGVNSAIGTSDLRTTVSKTSYAGGSENDGAFSALRTFAQGLAPAAAPAAQGTDPDADLRAYARSVGVDEPASRTGAGPQLADADNLLDAIRGWQHKDDTAAPATPAIPRAQAPVKAPPTDATFVGSKTCLRCHATQAKAFGDTLMGRIGLTHPGKFDCESCHGPGSAHVKAGGGRGVGGIISFRADDLSRTPKENNAICLGCHEKGDRNYWSGSAHENRGLACTNCHTVMRKVSVKYNLKTAFEPDTCFQCHKDRRAQMYRSSHMPLREGKIVCSDCHNPHGSATQALLRENSINDTCYKCHAEKRGPFLFEHQPVRENCDNCHNPHGSVNEYMLKVSRPRLCGECHSVGHGMTSGVTAVQTMGRSCENCHNAIHGTNDPSGSLFHR